MAVLSILAVAGVRAFSDRAIPSLIIYSLGILAIILIQFIIAATSFTLAILSNRASLSFVPLRDSELFVADVRDIYRSSIQIPAENPKRVFS